MTEVPDAFAVIGRSVDTPELVMAMRHRSLPQIGLQFHPESVLSPFGARILSQVLEHFLSTPVAS